VTRHTPAPIRWLAGLLAVYLIAPLVAGAQQARLADWSSVDFRALADASAVSIASATIATILIALGGVPLGYVLARAPGRAMAVLGFAVQLPLALPPLASGVLLLFLVGYNAPLGRLAAGALTDSFTGIVLSEVFVAAPFLIIAARSAFASTDPAFEGVGATLGHRPLDVFLRVSLPIAWPSILSGMLLAWLRAFGEFGATVMVAYHPYSLPVYTYVAFGAQGLPAMLPVLLPTLVFAIAIMALNAAAIERLNGGASRASRNNGALAALSNAPAPATFKRPGAIDLTLNFEKRLDGFHLDVAWAPHARRLAILGPSGSGKTLTLKLIAGIERCDRGTVTVAGRDLTRLDPATRAIAYVPQNYGLFPHLAVVEQLCFPVGADLNSARRWIERLGLQGLENRRPAELSLGQQQRVALARALVRPADLLMLDEPFSALDAPLRSRLRNELLSLQEEIALTTMLVTHDPMEAALLADELLVLDAGQVLQSGPTRDVFARPANETVARLLGAENVGEGLAISEDSIAIGNDVILGVSGPALRPGQRVGWSFPAACARLAAGGRYQGLVEHVSFVGTERRLLVCLGDARVRLFGAQSDRLSADSCRFDIDLDSVQVWPLE
jgi:molybdate transport system permease protein